MTLSGLWQERFLIRLKTKKIWGLECKKKPNKSLFFFSSAADIVSGADQIGGPIGVRPSSVRLSSTIHLNRYSSYSSQPILTKLGTRLEPLEGQKLLEAEFWIFALCGKKQTTLSFFSNLFKSLLLLQFSTNLNQTWHKVRTLSGAQNVGSRILNFCLWMGISRRLC